jgi:hypothetical protein
MSERRMSKEEVVEHGTRIYDEKIRPLVEQDHYGEFVAVDVETGDYYLAKDGLAAYRLALSRRPEAILYLAQVGYRGAIRIGASGLSVKC